MSPQDWKIVRAQGHTKTYVNNELLGRAITATEAVQIFEEQGALSSVQRAKNISEWHAEEAGLGMI